MVPMSKLNQNYIISKNNNYIIFDECYKKQ